jgi:hypothetical protein
MLCKKKRPNTKYMRNIVSKNDIVKGAC